MFIASGLGFLKMIVLAIVLEPHDYGRYVSIFGLATLFGAIFSFGIIERTIKMYPRYWIDGRLGAILRDARNIINLLLSRFGILASISILISFFLTLTFSWIEIFSIFLLAFLSALLALLASLYRAAGSKKALENFSIARGLSILVLGFLGGFFFESTGAIFGDIFGSIIVLFYSLFVIKRLYSHRHVKVSKNRLADKVQTENFIGHGKLYFANLFTGSTSMLDRALISANLGPSLAGSYGFIMLIPQIFQMLINIISQLIGPKIIKSNHLKKITVPQHGLLTQGGLFGLSIIFFVLCVFVTKEIPFIREIFYKYKISNLSIVLSGLLSLGQIYSLIEFHLIALNAESFILRASLWSNIIFYLMFIIAIYFSLQVEYFIGVAAFSRCLHVGILYYWLKKVKHEFFFL